ncbi:hypothetical protein [Roseivirga thermotolerans]|nr:hypothetical protein [Roseivirga thermotolerans]
MEQLQLAHKINMKAVGRVIERTTDLRAQLLVLKVESVAEIKCLLAMSSG